MPTAAELTEHTGLLHLLFEQTQGKLYVVLLDLNDHGVTSGAGAVSALAAVLPD
jgi:hypothetical protein